MARLLPLFSALDSDAGKVNNTAPTRLLIEVTFWVPSMDSVEVNFFYTLASAKIPRYLGNQVVTSGCVTNLPIKVDVDR